MVASPHDPSTSETGTVFKESQKKTRDCACRPEKVIMRRAFDAFSPGLLSTEPSGENAMCSDGTA